MKYRTKKVLAMILATVLLFSTVDSAFAEGSLAGPAVMTESVAEQESVDTGIVINSETTTENQSSEETVVTLAEEKAEVPVEITGTELETAGPETIVSGETQAVVSGESSKETRVVIAGENSGETIIPENAGETIVPGNAEETVVPEVAEETDGEVVPEEAELLGAFTITYKSANSEMGSVSRSSETINNNYTQIKGSTAKPESGYKFLYWTMDDQSEPYSENATFKPTLRETHTYTAYFVETKERTVHFDMNGHGEKYQPKDIIVLAGETISTPSEPEIGHIESEKKVLITRYYQFQGWDYDFNEPVNSNITINAKWQEGYLQGRKPS